jgi:hypothetical protein
VHTVVVHNRRFAEDHVEQSVEVLAERILDVRAILWWAVGGGGTSGSIGEGDVVVSLVVQTMNGSTMGRGPEVKGFRPVEEKLIKGKVAATVAVRSGCKSQH